MNNKLVGYAPLVLGLKRFAEREGHGCTKENVEQMLTSFRTQDHYFQQGTGAENAAFEAAIPLLEKLAELDKKTEQLFEELRAQLGVERVL